MPSFYCSSSDFLQSYYLNLLGRRSLVIVWCTFSAWHKHLRPFYTHCTVCLQCGIWEERNSTQASQHTIQQGLNPFLSAFNCITVLQQMCAFEICTDECGKTAKQSAYLILCVSGDSSVLMDLHWPWDCTAQSNILSIGSVCVVLLWGIFLNDLGQ